MTVGRAERRAERRDRVAAMVRTESTDAALDLLDLVDLAWHDCYGEISPPEAVLDDIFVLSQGTLDGMTRAAHLAVVDWRDLRVAADQERQNSD